MLKDKQAAQKDAGPQTGVGVVFDFQDLKQVLLKHQAILLSSIPPVKGLIAASKNPKTEELWSCKKRDGIRIHVHSNKPDPVRFAAQTYVSRQGPLKIYAGGLGVYIGKKEGGDRERLYPVGWDALSNLFVARKIVSCEVMLGHDDAQKETYDFIKEVIKRGVSRYREKFVNEMVYSAYILYKASPLIFLRYLHEADMKGIEKLSRHFPGVQDKETFFDYLNKIALSDQKRLEYFMGRL